MKNRYLEAMDSIMEYLNKKYPDATINYNNENFIIEGDEADKIKEDIEDVLYYCNVFADKRNS